MRKKPGPKPRDPYERFWEKVDQDGVYGCWEWTGHRLRNGYGTFGAGLIAEGTFHMAMAHRVAYSMCVGPIPEGLCVLHSCDNPACCNPSHLRAGTQAENVADMYRRGRQNDPGVPGERNGRAKLTSQQVRQIREHRVSLADALRRFGISKTQYYRIRRGDGWESVQLMEKPVCRWYEGTDEGEELR